MHHTIASLVAAIPSPSSGAIHIGKLQLRAYGLMIALGALAAVWLASRRLEASGNGRREDMSAIAMWALPAGVIGSRVYHVITDWKSFRGDWLRALKIWEGGLGIWGGIALGTIVGLWAARRRGVSTAAVLRASTPALPLAQAIGRLGNWWNQELFGKPTRLPWGLKIAPEHRPDAFRDVETFHPTFLYESLWNLALCGALIWIDRKYKPRAGRLFAMYVAGYTFLRFFIERLRVDPASKVAGLRVNEWVSAIVFVLAVAYIVFGPKGVAAEAEPAVIEGARGAADADAQAVSMDVLAPADVGGDPEVSAALGKYAYDGDLGLEPEPEETKVVHTITDVGGDPEVSAVLGKFAYDESFGEVPSYDPLRHEPADESPTPDHDDESEGDG